MKAKQAQTIGQRMRIARKAAGLTLMQLAVRIETSSPSYLSKIEHDENTPGTDLLNAICEATGANVEWVLNGRGPMGRK